MIIIFAVLGAGLGVEEVIARDELEGLERCQPANTLAGRERGCREIGSVPWPPCSKHRYWLPIWLPISPRVIGTVESECRW